MDSKNPMVWIIEPHLLGPPKEPKIMARYPKIESLGSMGSIISAILEVQVLLGSAQGSGLGYPTQALSGQWRRAKPGLLGPRGEFKVRRIRASSRAVLRQVYLQLLKRFFCRLLIISIQDSILRTNKNHGVNGRFQVLIR